MRKPILAITVAIGALICLPFYTSIKDFFDANFELIEAKRLVLQLSEHLDPITDGHETERALPAISDARIDSASHTTFPNAVLWVTGTITAEADNRTLLPAPSSEAAKALWLRNREPENTTAKSLGHLPKAVVSCEYFSVTFAVWILECLPRLAAIAPLIRSEGIPYILPGEPFALQYAVEILHLPEQQAYILPSHLLWIAAYGMYHLSLNTMLHVPRLETLAQQRAALLHLRDDVMADMLLRHHQSKSKGTLQVVLSQRLDMTMPVNHSSLLQFVCDHLTVQASCYTVRFETLSVTEQIKLAANTDVLLGPPGPNLLNMVYLPKGSLVIEMYPTRKMGAPGYITATAPDLQYMMYEGVYSPKTGKVQELCEWLGLEYQKQLPQKDITSKTQPVADLQSLVQLIQQWHAKRNTFTARHDPPTKVLEPSPPLIQCQNLFHLKRTYRLLGTFKDTYFVPSHGFALKVANSVANRKRAAGKGFVGDWRTLQREMVILRNFSEPHITPAMALCFDHPTPKYAQEKFSMQLGFAGQTRAVRIANVSHFFIALAGYLQLWRSHERRGSFLFYCDAGPKNWAISRDGTTLQMFDFDNTYTLLPGTLCNNDLDCGCCDSVPSACVNHRCTSEGMEQKMGSMVGDWIRNFVINLLPAELRSDPATMQLANNVKKEVKCEEVHQYLKSVAPNVIAGQPYPCRPNMRMDPRAVRQSREELISKGHHKHHT